MDGEIVAITDQVPVYNMDVEVWDKNKALSLESSFYIDVPFNQSIQVDYIHVFNFTEPNLQNYSGEAG